ncbi:dihydrofolate synthase/folylpolyglutamate synthase [Enterococcus sp. PF1-24]|uniref:bifunctional folylpolyglutamate synthase/dihydrofolate synthase n=1 Tax=unclassified Enterococcus TaxID=2608891 RepID=UPI0024730754|nr:MULTISPECIES: folylpolyglutamate synthase/dihydrofolate synthase family protein [unclassified Enterococcus]MDH6365798.1 dihydrofolate synthase/folylpolyglutamate synthase [Enterococcus sp. PFB1-1]MDH6402898.1 dihydrofolate synthase/folylpolyglutamate synthase [Enterococcus sp. PF1-24]
MTLTVEEATNWIHSRLPFGSRPGLQRVEALLTRLNHPEKQVPTIHIAGTNGKGSTVTYLRCLLEETGLKVGTFTSPYIETFNERIAINGAGISDEALFSYISRYQEIVAEMDAQPEISGITEFETLTAMAFDYFLQEKVDVAIIEVGLGGLLDSTNVAQPLLTGITTIGLDHTDILGETLSDIAEQKAGIIKPNIPVVTGNIAGEALRVIEAVAGKQKAPHFSYSQDYQVVYRSPDKVWGEVFDFQNQAGKFKQLKIAMVGQHQVENAGMALELFYQYCQLTGSVFREKDIRKALLKAHWPGRMEKMSNEPLIILDGAHNDHAMERLIKNMKSEFGDYQINILFSAITTKDIQGMIQQLRKIPNVRIYLTTFDYPKALDLSDFNHLEDEKVTIVSLWQFGLAELLESMGSDELLLLTGSLYFISQVRELLVSLQGN